MFLFLEDKPKEAEDASESKDDGFFKILDRAEVEGRVLDLSFVQKIVVVLTSVSAEGSSTNDTSKFTGDQG